MNRYIKPSAMGLLILLICQMGCATNKVVGHWRDYEIVANGHDNEWQGPPEYYDRHKQVAIRVINDQDTLYLCVSTGNNDVKRQMHANGLTLWLDPRGGKAHTFGIHLPGTDSHRPPGRELRPKTDTLPSEDERQHPSGKKQPPFFPEPLEELEVTYEGATGPLKMKIAEMRQDGIDICVGHPGNGRLVYEFNIGFKAAPCLSKLKPGMVVGMGIRSGTAKQKETFPDGQMGRGDPSGGGPGGGDGPGPGHGMDGGGKGGGPGGIGSDRKGDPFEVWMQVQLAHRISG